MIPDLPIEILASRNMRCPICKNTVQEKSDPNQRSYFPFCSERCKLIDLGRWLDGKYQIPAVDSEESDTESTREIADE